MSIKKIDIDTVKSLIDLMEERELLTLEVSSGDESIKLTKHYEQPIIQSVPSSMLAHQDTSAVTNNTNVKPESINPDEIETSPMVGVFYAAPSPNDPPFATVGQKVEAGDQLGIIEAMKIMNPLEATKSGIIKEILVNNSDVVEFGQPIIRYES